jgi:hypothetical protein
MLIRTFMQKYFRKNLINTYFNLKLLMFKDLNVYCRYGIGWII